MSLNVGYTFDNGNKLSADFSRLKEENQQNTKTITNGSVSMGPMGSVPQKTTAYGQVANNNKRTDYALSYSGNDDKHDWMVRAYKSVYNKDYSSFTDTYKKLFMRGQWIDQTHQDPSVKHDAVKRTLSVIEGKDTISLSDKHRMTAGFEYRQDKSEGTRLKKKNTPLPGAGNNVHDAYDEAEINYLAAYVQDEFRPDAKWLIIPSVRYDHSDQFGSEVTSRLGTTYNAADDVRIKAVIGQGYKTPTVNELYHYWEMYTGMQMGSSYYRYGQFFEGNPDLKPEKSLSYELAVEKDWGDRTTVHLGAFRNEVKDLINSYYTGRDTNDTTHPGLVGRDNIMTYHNIPEATLQGVELYGSHRLGKDIYLNAGYTFLDAKDKTKGTRLTDRAKHQVTFGLSYQPENIYAWDVSFDLVSNLNYYYRDAERSTMMKAVYDTKNFTIANIMTSKHLNKDTKIYLGIDNISNHQNFGAYSDGNLGRMYRVGMEYKF